MVVLPMQQSPASEDLFPSIGTSKTTQYGQMQLSGSSATSSDATVQLLHDTNLPTAIQSNAKQNLRRRSTHRKNS
jgi:hypothetical protein